MQAFSAPPVFLDFDLKVKNWAKVDEFLGFGLV